MFSYIEIFVYAKGSKSRASYDCVNISPNLGHEYSFNWLRSSTSDERSHIESNTPTTLTYAIIAHKDSIRLRSTYHLILNKDNNKFIQNRSSYKRQQSHPCNHPFPPRNRSTQNLAHHFKKGNNSYHAVSSMTTSKIARRPKRHQK